MLCSKYWSDFNIDLFLMDRIQQCLIRIIHEYMNTWILNGTTILKLGLLHLLMELQIKQSVELPHPQGSMGIHQGIQPDSIARLSSRTICQPWSSAIIWGGFFLYLSIILSLPDTQWVMRTSNQCTAVVWRNKLFLCRDRIHYFPN